MKIIITPDKKKDFKILLPTSLMKKRFLWKTICANEIEEEKINKVINIIKNIYKILKAYVKENGHFTLLDIDSQDVKIKIII